MHTQSFVVFIKRQTTECNSSRTRTFQNPSQVDSLFCTPTETPPCLQREKCTTKRKGDQLMLGSSKRKVSCASPKFHTNTKAAKALRAQAQPHEDLPCKSDTLCGHFAKNAHPFTPNPVAALTATPNPNAQTLHHLFLLSGPNKPRPNPSAHIPWPQVPPHCNPRSERKSGQKRLYTDGYRSFRRQLESGWGTQGPNQSKTATAQVHEKERLGKGLG